MVKHHLAILLVNNISSLESATDSSISFLSDSSYIPKLKETKSQVILNQTRRFKVLG